MVRDLLGDSSEPARVLPPENEANGYRSMASSNRANPLLVEGYLSTAETVAASAVQERLARVAPCAEGADRAACGHAFIESFAARAFRRPLTERERGPLKALFDAGNATDYARGVELVIQAVLQSPQFLYRIDSLKAATPETGAIALGGYELAARLAFSLWGSVPDEALLAAAGEGRLATPADVEREARRLLADPRAHDLVRDFSEQWLYLSRLDGAVRVGTDVAPSTLSGSLKTSLTRFLDETYFGEGGTFEKLILDPKVWLDSSLAPIYRAATPGATMAAYQLPEPRFGLLTQPGLLAQLSHSDQTAPVIRGVFMRERILCLPVAPPPPKLNAVPPDPDPNATTRERFRQHTEQEACSGCHQLIDGVGFGFERYDQLGRYRAVENGFDVDESGQMLASGEAELDGAFSGVAELAERIAKSPRARDCLASNWFTYTFGREDEPSDQCSLTQLKQRFANSGGDLKELLVALTQTDSFLYRPAITEAP
jgi:Protein of unknown function (DUF1588)/Protein of unknown function (DUF1592)/Protein of unknown function (DUF1595)/Protein of unknown function (DUF1585)/Protein of unknown function (DUF1587)